MSEIRAAVAHRFREPLSIETVTLRAPEATEVEVALDACAICQSDISWLEGHWGGELPAVYGHEAAGRITALGDRVRGYRLGDPVLVTLIRACGSCAACTGGRPVACADTPSAVSPITLPDGRPVVQSMHCGAFAERVVVDTSQLARLPNEMPMDVAALLACGVITGVGAVVNSAQLRIGQTAVVIGAGGVGLNAVQGASLAGASTIIVVDAIESKLDAALEFGATHVLLANQAEPWLEVARITNGRMADAVFVTVGALAAYEQAPHYLGAGGSVVLIGMPETGARATYDPCTMAALGQRMIGSKMGDTVLARDIPWLVNLYQQGRLKLDELVSGRWPLERINEAIADTKTGSSRRNVIVFGDQQHSAASPTPHGA